MYDIDFVLGLTREVKPTGALILLALIRLMREENTDELTVSQAVIARACGLCVETVQRITKSMERRGIIYIAGPGRGDRNQITGKTYRIKDWMLI